MTVIYITKEGKWTLTEFTDFIKEASIPERFIKYYQTFHGNILFMCDRIDEPINPLLCEMLGGLRRGSAVIFGSVVIDRDTALTTVNDKLVRLFKSKYKQHFISPWEVIPK